MSLSDHASTVRYTHNYKVFVEKLTLLYNDLGYLLSVNSRIINEVASHHKVSYMSLLVFQKNVSIFTIKITIFYYILHTIAPIEPFSYQKKNINKIIIINVIKKKRRMYRDGLVWLDF